MKKGVVCCIDKCKAIEVVDVAVLPVGMVDIIFRHGCLRTVENRRFVHVVPYEHVTS